MDPDAALANIRAIIASENADAWIDELVEAIDALDQWISRGGFLPSAWQK